MKVIQVMCAGDIHVFPGDHYWKMEPTMGWCVYTSNHQLVASFPAVTWVKYKGDERGA